MAEKPISIRPAVKPWYKRETAFLVFIGLMIAFPFVMNLITGTGLNEGITKFWQGQLITFFIMAVFAMSYDLLIGYGGILSFGHAASFGGGAYAFALLMKFWAPNITSNYRIMVGSADITMGIILLIILLVVLAISILIGLLFAATSIRLKGSYFAMLTLAISSAFFILIKATDFHKWTGADEGLHGVPLPAWLNPTQNRLTVYLLSHGQGDRSQPRERGPHAHDRLQPGCVPRDRLRGIFHLRRYRRYAILRLEYERHPHHDLSGDDLQCAYHDHHGWYGYPGGSHLWRSHQPGDPAVLLYLVRRALAAGLWDPLYPDRHVPTLWHCGNLASAPVPDQEWLAAFQ
jgi:hypothetical protein